jgi:hypothetical protein
MVALLVEVGCGAGAALVRARFLGSTDHGVGVVGGFGFAAEESLDSFEGFTKTAVGGRLSHAAPL